jgi:hypothetical protein
MASRAAQARGGARDRLVLGGRAGGAGSSFKILPSKTGCAVSQECGANAIGEVANRAVQAGGGGCCWLVLGGRAGGAGSSFKILPSRAASAVEGWASVSGELTSRAVQAGGGGCCWLVLGGRASNTPSRSTQLESSTTYTILRAVCT